jgi:hypothetical protein
MVARDAEIGGRRQRKGEKQNETESTHYTP